MHHERQPYWLRGRRVWVTLVTATLCVSVITCTSDWEKRLIADYNDALIVAYRTGDVSALGFVAGNDEVRKVSTLVDLKRSQNIVLESSLDDLQIVTSETTGPGGAIVETREIWTYQDRPLTPGIRPGTRFVAKMTMRYECERRNGKWTVRRVRTLTNELIEPKGFLPEQQSHGVAETAHD